MPRDEKSTASPAPRAHRNLQAPAEGQLDLLTALDTQNKQQDEQRKGDESK